MMRPVSFPCNVLLPVATPLGVIAFLYSDLRTFRTSFINRYYNISLSLNPPHPLKQKISKYMRVLKRKYFKSNVQPSNRPTTKNILKYNSLLYSSIYSYLNYIYILHRCWCVGRCWTCWIPHFQQSNKLHPTEMVKNILCWTCWTPSNIILSMVNLHNLIIISNFNNAVGRLDGWKQK